MYQVMLIVGCLFLSASLAPVVGVENEINPLLAAVAAAENIAYLMSSTEMSDFTPRAHTALSFVKNIIEIPEDSVKEMANERKRVLLSLLREGDFIHFLPSHINAQYAWCQDPRDFEGLDLIELLRNETDKAMTMDFNLPAVILTLCISKDSRYEDFDQLIQMYDSRRNDKLSIKALIIIAMAACRHQMPTYHYRQTEARVQDFIKLCTPRDNINTYSRALSIQALNAWGYNSSSSLQELLRGQLEDGSFGDFLSTYAAIPALLGTSLADLQCKSRNYHGKSILPVPTKVSNPSIEFTLVIPRGENVGKHTIKIDFKGKYSFYELMKIASKTSPLYRFEYDEMKGQKKISSFSGISNDAETGEHWVLHKEINPKETIVETGDIDFLYPEDGDHYIFKLEMA